MLVQRFEEQVRQYPHQIAVKTPTDQITYGELDQKANQVAYIIYEALLHSSPLCEEERIRYQRQMMIAGWGLEAQEKLKAATVFVAGAGGSASPLIMQLALCGFGTIIVADDDLVELSNLNRQCLHDESRIGMNKAMSAKLTAERLNPHVRVIPHAERITRENVDTLVGAAAMIFDNVDHLETKFILSECAARKRIPHLISSMMDLNGYAAILYPPHTPCFHCLYDREKVREIAEIRAVTQNAKQQLPNPVAAPSLFLSTGFIVNEALKILLEIGKPAYNKYFLFNQRGGTEIAETAGHLSITFPFSEHFRRISREQGFDWNTGWRGRFVEELTIVSNPQCPLCGEQGRAGREAAAAVEGEPPAKPKAGIAVMTENRTEGMPRRVGLLFAHGIDMIIGLVGALKAGVTYVPLDPNYPDQRLIYMMEDAGVEWIVTDQENLVYAQRLAGMTRQYVKILNISTIDHNTPELRLRRILRSKEPLYILYTSGSTGKPKGVYQSHENVWHFTKAYARDMGIRAGDRLTLLGAFSADGPVQDIYGGLLHGAAVYPLNIKKQANLADFADWLRRERITVCHCVPTVFRYFTRFLNGTEDFPDLRMIVLGGEGILDHDVSVFKRCFGCHTTLVNIYGQTESSYNSAFFVRHDTPYEKSTLGQVVEDTELWVVNERNEEVNDLEIGEIVVVSEHVALGYWNDPERTARVFAGSPSLGRLYWTGDLGRKLLDGTVEFAGRKDQQVKIRGFRVDLSEIESRLLDYPGVREAVVAAKDGPEKDRYLCAYLVPSEELPEANLRTYLAAFLPDYMVPAHFVQMERLPLTATGKLDRKALPDPERGSAEVNFLPPCTETERVLTQFWGDVLRISPEKISVRDSFFELGGNSLLVMSLAQRINQAFQTDLRIPDLFANPTVVMQAGLLTDSRRSAEPGVWQGVIPILEKAETYPVSSAQMRIFVLQQIEGSHLGYNLPCVLQVEGGLDRERYGMAIGELVKRHESLRTSLHVLSGSVVQRIHPQAACPIEEWVLQAGAGHSEVEAVVRGFVRLFDLAVPPLMRAGLIHWGDIRILLFDIHHAVSDGFSNDLIIHEFMRLYAGETLPPLRIQYRDFAGWQNAMLESPEGSAQEQYWLRIFDPALSGREIPVPDLPTDYPRPPQQSFAGDQITFSAGRDLTEALRRLANDTGTTLYMILLAAYSILLARYSGQEDIIIGSPVAGRRNTELEQIVGMFVNTLAMRTFPAADKPFTEFLREVKEQTLGALENQDYPFETLVSQLKLARDPGRNPLFDTMFRMQNFRREVRTNELTVKPFAFLHPVAPFDLQLTGTEWDGEVHFTYQYAIRLFRQETVNRMGEHFIHILQGVAKAPRQRLGDIPVLTEKDKEKLLCEWNQTVLPFARERMIHGLFAEQAALDPERTAVTVRGERMTYGELATASDRLAACLRAKGVVREEIVGIMLRRSTALLAAILGVLKAGGAYLPIDPEYPAERIRYMLEDSRARILIRDREGGAEPAFAGEIIPMDGLTSDVLEETSLPVDDTGSSDNLCYLIYTSGSTGRPKGTMLTHRSVHNFLVGIQRILQLSPDMTVGSLTTVSFDIFVLESLLPLTVGASTALAAEEEQRDIRALREMVTRENVRVLQLTPSRLQMWMENRETEALLAPMHTILMGGEVLPLHLLRWLQSKTRARIFNLYGPTETAVWSSAADLTEAQEVTIGRPMVNTRFYILDSQDHPVPEGAAGELYIGGEGVARGYLGREDLTAERFLPDPFHSGGRMYRTGDLVRRRSDGQIEYKGRKDQQVKIRGYRIELGEIEHHIHQYPGIQDHVVVAQTGEHGIQFLVCYYVAENEIGIAALRGYLLQRLPDYMVPGFYQRLDKLPLTPNGKLNRSLLPGLSQYRPHLGTAYAEAETGTEKAVAAIWARWLRMDPIGIHDNFFDLGGNSILLVQVHDQIDRAWPGRTSMVDLFTYPTIAKLAAYLDKQDSRSSGTGEAEAYWERELAEPFRLITLPAAFLSEEMGSREEFQFILQPETADILRRIAREGGWEVQEILAAMYIYLFREISGQEDLIIEAELWQSPGMVFPLRISCSEMDDLVDLFQQVHIKYRKASEMGHPPLPGLVRRKYSPVCLLPFFGRKGDTAQRDNEMILAVTEREGTMVCTCTYEGSKLRGDQVESLISRYVQRITMLVGEFSE